MMEKIYSVFVTNFISKEKTDLSVSYEVNDHDTFNILCIKDNDDMVDIKTHRRYHLLKRNDKGILSIEEYNNIVLFLDYAIRASEYKKVNLKDMINALSTRKEIFLSNIKEKQDEKIK